MKNRSAFTLAEILITLLIIGVISSLVIPLLLNDTRDAELKTAFKKSYANINQVFQQIKLDNGGTFNGICSGAWNCNCFKNAFKNYMSYTKDCDDYDVYGTCWHNYNNFYYMNKQPVAFNGWPFNCGVSALVLADGSYLSFSFYMDNNSDLRPGVINHINVDVNGAKGPNTLGKDIYTIYILNDKIYPYGSSVDGYESTCDTSAASYPGLGCAAKVLKGQDY